MKRIIIILVTASITAIIGSIVLIPMIHRFMDDASTKNNVEETEGETKKKSKEFPSFAWDKEEDEEEEKETVTTEGVVSSTPSVEESFEENEETSPIPSTESIEIIESYTEPSSVEVESISETTPPSETKSQVFLGEDMEIINAGFERTARMSAIKEEIRSLMGSDIPQEVAQKVYNLASEGQSLAIANIDTFSYIIGQNAEGKFSYMEDEARLLNMTCFEQDIEFYRNDYSEFQTYMDWANLFITNS